MRYKVIACKVFSRELYMLSWNHAHMIDIQFMRQQLHLEPDKLRHELQRAIDAVEAEQQQSEYDTHYDAILLAYGLCSNGLTGLCARSVPLVMPRVHDCISVFLGSSKEYQKRFNAGNGAIYWYTPGWIEHCQMPSKERYDQLYQSYLEKFGQDNADYLLDMEKAWMKEYKKAIYIEWPELEHPAYERFSQECADYFHWDYERAPGNSGMLKRMLDGEWNPSEFLVVPPGGKIRASHGESIVEAIL